jgi:hypothetical protein
MAIVNYKLSLPGEDAARRTMRRSTERTIEPGQAGAGEAQAYG